MDYSDSGRTHNLLALNRKQTNVDYSKKYNRKLFIILAGYISFAVISSGIVWIILSSFFSSDNGISITLWAIISALIVLLTTYLATNTTSKPLSTLADAIIFAGHSSRGGTAPQTDNLNIGRELVASLAMQVYDLASMAQQSSDVVVSGIPKSAESPATAGMQAITPSILDHVGLPIFGIDSEQIVTAINKSACDYIGLTPEQVIGKPFYDSVKLAFQSEETFEAWLKNQQQNSINGVRLWERVRITDPNGNAIKQFDLVASFSKQNQSGTETMICIYDRTEQYSRDDQEISFVAMAVHELRTPLTILKGYVEVFEDEVGPTLTPELTGFMHKMQASTQQLTAFVGNILNVARIEENQLVLTLQQHNWAEILKVAVDDLALRAGVNGKHIELHVGEGIPPVAVDRISIHEVINNLVDNAIKYSGNSDKIIISTSLNQEGLIETSVQDFGIGIPASAMPDLFQKFYRSHKSSVQVSGTGLGLYLCKSVINAHDGNIWVRSKEGEGSVFTFTIQAFDHLKHEQTGGQDGIMRGAHGWIKNHSLNRQ
ncbi:PAS domain-containing protein [Candidatus Saccharibacteria bacterium]|nr:PAS domain-containing protein [Candidatus Saccharibacteria bacterium]